MDNVLLVTIDSLRADHVGYQGYDRDVTPNIDRYASEGSRFTNAYAHVGGTRFSFPSILSGVTPLMYGGYERISDDQTLLSEVFADAGYRTGGFHSNLYVSGRFGYDRGWDEFYDSAPDESWMSKARKWAKTNLVDTPVFPLLKKGYDALESSQGVNVGSYHVPADEITDMAIEFIEESPAEPTFLWVHYMDVHHPFLPPEEYQLEFRDEAVPDTEAIQLRRKFIESPEEVTHEEYQTFIDLYDAEIRFNDDEVGRLFEAAEEAWNEDEEYLLALTADHGDHFLEHGYFGGALGLDVKTHVPLFVNGCDDTDEYDDLVGLVDLPTTLADAAGLSVPDIWYGHSLQGLMREDEWPRKEIIGGWDNEEGDTLVVREHDWKLIRRPEETNELYHLADDPGEQDNVVDEFPEQERRLQKKLDEHMELVRATDDETVERPDMDEDLKERLRRLGYSE
jgi:arylsulfatase A-like enzyme